MPHSCERHSKAHKTNFNQQEADQLAIQSGSKLAV